MNIQQLSVAYQADEDRISLRILTADLQELQLLFTRRFMLGAWPVLQRATTQTTAALAAAKPHVAAFDEASKLAMAEFKRAESLQGADFQTPYGADRVKWRPLGGTPLLVTEVQVTPQPEGKLSIIFIERMNLRTPRNLQMHLEQALIHGLMQLLAQTLTSSGWNDATPWSSTLEEHASSPIRTLAPDGRPLTLN